MYVKPSANTPAATRRALYLAEQERKNKDKFVAVVKATVKTGNPA